MAEEPKSSDRGGGGEELSCRSKIATLKRMLTDLEDRARPIQEEIRVVQQLLRDLQDEQFLQERRQQMAETRQMQQG
jgi:hypothetical protein